jgi:hypothetical protein
VEDQQVAAAIMKLGAGMFLWGVVGYLFITWWRDEKAGKATDNRRTGEQNVQIAGMTVSGRRVDEVLTWERVQAEFDRLDREASGEHPVA